MMVSQAVQVGESIIYNDSRGVGSKLGDEPIRSLSSHLHIPPKGSRLQFEIVEEQSKIGHHRLAPVLFQNGESDVDGGGDVRIFNGVWTVRLQVRAVPSS